MPNRIAWLILCFTLPAIGHSADGPSAVRGTTSVVAAAPEAAVRPAAALGTSHRTSSTPAPAAVGEVRNWQLQYALQPVRIGSPGAIPRPVAPVTPAANRNDFSSQTNWQISLQSGVKLSGGPTGSSAPPRKDLDFRNTATVALQPGLTPAGREAAATPVLVSGTAVIGDTKPNLDISPPKTTGVEWDPDPAQMLPGY